ELLNATQGIAFRNAKSSEFIEGILDIYRSEVEFLNTDRLLHDDIEKSIGFLQGLAVDTELL
ncbi:MAG: histidine ammonia-lyase, partial [Flavobacteriales bacterium]|nr:histidine ammonia-lyase [Flavobacteriales bacterium]